MSGTNAIHGIVLLGGLLLMHEAHGVLEHLILVLGITFGIPAARRVHMTAMPQMVALFNGVGGGAVALIAWTEYRHHFGGDFPLKTEIPSLFAAIVGSISFWGSNIAFGKLQAILPGRPIKLPMQAVVNLSLFVIALASACM